MKWALIAIAGVAAWWLYKYPYAVGALVKYPGQLNTIAKQLNDASGIVDSVSATVDNLKNDWAAIEAKL